MHELAAEVTVDVPFYDVDPMGVVWHGHYIKYFEQARGTLLRLIDYDYPQMRDSGYMWPVVECRLKYVQSATYGQQIIVRAELKEWENRIGIDYVIRSADDGRRLTKGKTIQVAVEISSGELQFVSPPILASKLEKKWSS
jgi:acyl-CoA thioester hydrolase